MGYLNASTAENAFNEVEELEKIRYARLACPLMVEIIAEVE